jgi:hypothetical protein
MNEATVIRGQRQRTAKNCRHHWIIETPHGATSRGVCKRCGASKRYPNAPEEVMRRSGRTLRRWSREGSVSSPTEISLSGDVQDEY